MVRAADGSRQRIGRRRRCGDQPSGRAGETEGGRAPARSSVHDVPLPLGGSEGAQPPASPCRGPREAWPQRVGWLDHLRVAQASADGPPSRTSGHRPEQRPPGRCGQAPPPRCHQSRGRRGRVRSPWRWRRPLPRPAFHPTRVPLRDGSSSILGDPTARQGTLKGEEQRYSPEKQRRTQRPGPDASPVECREGFFHGLPGFMAHAHARGRESSRSRDVRTRWYHA